MAEGEGNVFARAGRFVFRRECALGAGAVGGIQPVLPDGDFRVTCGSVEAPEFETWGVSLDGALPTKTWWGVRVQNISQDVDRQRGIFTGFQQVPLRLFDRSPVFFPDQTNERLEYDELATHCYFESASRE